jgi:hypothetical protein
LGMRPDGASSEQAREVRAAAQKIVSRQEQSTPAPEAVN